MLLAVDTSTSQIGLAVFDNSQVLGEMTWRGPQRHTVELSTALTGLLSRSGISIDMIQAVGVAVGPGSFTSLRVGLSLVKGIALARNIPLIGINTLDILAAAQPQSKYPLAVVIQAGRNKLALGWYENINHFWVSQGVAEVTNVDSLAESIQKETVLCGELNNEERQKLMINKSILLASPALCVRRPSVLAELAWARHLQNDYDDAASLAPIYLHTV